MSTPTTVVLASASKAKNLDVSTVDDTGTYKALFIGTAGVVKVDMAEGGTGITFNIPIDGYMLAVQVNKVYSSGTSASNIVGLNW